MLKRKNDIRSILAAILAIAMPLNALLAGTAYARGQLISVGIAGFSDDAGTGAPPQLFRKIAQDLRTRLAAGYKDVLPRVLKADADSLSQMNLEQLTSIGKQQGVMFVVRGGLLSASHEQTTVVQLYADVVSVETGRVVSVRSEGTSSKQGAARIDWGSPDFGGAASRDNALGQSLSAAIEMLAASIHQALTSDASPSPEASAEVTPAGPESTEGTEAQSEADDELRQLLAQAESFMAGEGLADSQGLEALQEALKNLNTALETKASLIEKGEDTTGADEQVALRKQELQAALSMMTEQASSSEPVTGDSQSLSEKRSLLGKVGEYATEALNVLQKVHEMQAMIRGNQQPYSDQSSEMGEQPGEAIEEATGDITGVITDAGVPVEGASVTESESGITTVTDNNGSYRLNGVVGGLANLVVTKSGKQVAAGKVDLKEGSSAVADFDFKVVSSKGASTRIIPSAVMLKSGGANGGVVKGQVLDPQGKPVKFALVNLKGLGSARTDSTGNYTFFNVPAGAHSLTAQKSGLKLKSKQVQVSARKTSQAEIQFSSGDKIVSAQTVRPIIVRSAGAIVRGVITDEQNRPLAGVKSTAMLASAAASVVSASNGRYELRNLSSGHYRLLISKPGFKSASHNITLKVGETLSRDFRLERSSDPLARLLEKRSSEKRARSQLGRSETSIGKLAGRIVDERTGRPISTVVVSMAGATLSRTDGSGNYIIAKMSPGRHRISISKAGYEEQHRLVMIRAGELTRQDLRMSPLRVTTILPASRANGRILGQIVDARTGRPIPGAMVALSNKRSVTTNQGGVFDIGGLPAGSYEIVVRRTGYVDATRRIAVRQGQSVTLNLRLVVRPAVPVRRVSPVR